MSPFRAGGDAGCTEHSSPRHLPNARRLPAARPPPPRFEDCPMDRYTIRIDPATTKLRRVGRLARRRMRIDGESLRNGVHTDGTVAIRISGLGAPVAGVPVSFQWKANRSIELVIVRAGVDGGAVRSHGGPARSGTAQASLVGDGSGIRYVAFCYDAPVTAKAADPRAVSI